MARRLFIVCLLLCGSVLADKERIYDDETFSQLTEDLIQEIRKRISDSSLPPESESAERCENDYGGTAEQDSIIMTRDSLANGAVFVAAPVVTSGPECSQECCDAENCNVAVFKFKDDEQSCYLFDCGNPGTCLFANHTGFTVLTLTSKKTAKVQGKNHEEDLVKLVTTTTLATTTTSTKKPEKDPVPLYGTCDKDKDCAGSRTACQLNYCVCQDGYHEQDTECRQDCSHFEFECANDGQPMTFPQCVALYDTCDGIEHCSDGSDERQCPQRASSQDISLGQNPQPYVPAEQQQAYMDLQQQQQQQLQLQQQQQLQLQQQQQLQLQQQQQQLPPAGYLPPPVQPPQQQLSSLQQQIQSLQAPQQGYVNQPLQQQPLPPQQQPPPYVVGGQQVPLQPQQVYRPVQPLQPQPQPVPVQQQRQQQYPGQVQPVQQVQPQQQPQQGPTFNNRQGQASVQGQVVPPQQQQQQQQVNYPGAQQPQLQQRPQQQQPAPSQAQQPPPQQPGQNIGEQYIPVQFEDHPHQVGRKPGTAYEAQRPDRLDRKPSLDRGQGRPVLRLGGDTDSSNMEGPKVQGADMMQPGPAHSSQDDPRESQPQRSDTQGMKAEVQPILKPSHPKPDVSSNGESTDPKPGNQNQKEESPDLHGSGDRGQNISPDTNYNRGGPRDGNPNPNPNHLAGGYTDGGYVSSNYNSPSKQFGPPRPNQGWDPGSRPATPFRSDPNNFRKPPGYNNHVYNTDYDNYDYGGGLNFGGSFGPDYNYYFRDSGYPGPAGRGRVPNRNPPPASSWDLRKAYLNLWNEEAQPEDQSEKQKSDEDDAWDDDDSQYKHENDDSQQTQEDVQPIKDGNDSEYKHQNDDSQESQEPTEPNKQGKGDDNDSAEKAKANKNPFKPTVSQQDSGESGGSQTHAEQGDDKADASKPKDMHTQPKVEEVEEGGDVQVNKEELSAGHESEGVQSNQGAVIALALGLSITALLLVFVGCRLRSVKRRLRRGRPLNSNEADYLVNGMYL